MCVSVCVCVCKEKEKEGWRKGGRETKNRENKKLKRVKTREKGGKREEIQGVFSEVLQNPTS